VIPVIGGAAGVVILRVAGLWDGLVNDAVQILFNEEMIVFVEHRVAPVFYEQLMNGNGPSGPVAGELLGAVRRVAAPFLERGRFGAAAGFFADAANNMVDENEAERGLAVFEGGSEPVLLFAPQRARPVFVAAAALARGEPERVERDEKCVAPFPCVIVARLPAPGISPGLGGEWRAWETTHALLERLGREVVRCAIEPAAGFAGVDAGHKT
jgi:hypothetical protein